MKYRARPRLATDSDGMVCQNELPARIAATLWEEER